MTDLQNNPLRDLNNARNLPKDTPETDSQITHFWSISKYGKRFTNRTGTVPADFARRLERERDEARQKLDCPRCEAGDDNFARLVRNREWLLEENRNLQKQLAAVNDQLLEAQAVIRTQRQNLRDDNAELQRVERERDNALALLRLHK
jgi:hypothetical protein